MEKQQLAYRDVSVLRALLTFSDYQDSDAKNTPTMISRLYLLPMKFAGLPNFLSHPPKTLEKCLLHIYLEENQKLGFLQQSFCFFPSLIAISPQMLIVFRHSEFAAISKESNDNAQFSHDFFLLVSIKNAFYIIYCSHFCISHFFETMIQKYQQSVSISWNLDVV